MTVEIITGGALEVLGRMAPGSAHCCVTSPPYWGLRDYGVEGQLGLEKTPEEYVANMVDVFRAVRRVLRDDGTLWLNLGDSYATSAGAVDRCPGGGEQGERFLRQGHINTQPNRMSVPGLKPKDMVGIPWRVAFALQGDGWYLRSDIIWAKPNPMPESVADRPTKAHEYLFLMAKSGKPLLWRHRDTREWRRARPAPDYAWRNTKTREETFVPQGRVEWRRFNLWCGFDYYYDADAIAQPLTKKTRTTFGAKRKSKGTDALGLVAADNWSRDVPDRAPKLRDDGSEYGANARTVWTVATQPYRGAHFATFPPKLVEPCIRAGCPEGGTVLDPFGGAGTTGLVADRLGRSAVLVELNPEYAEMARRRIRGDAPLFAEVT